MRSINNIVDKIEELLPNGKFGPDKHLILTGGEPLLGWQRSYIDLFEEFKSRNMNLTHITFETNGTQPLRDDLKDYLENEFIDVTFSVSSKLPSSGEKWEEAIRPEVIHEYWRYSDLTYFKWVVSSQEDFDDINRAVHTYNSYFSTKNGIQAGNDIPIYLMPAGGTTMHYDSNERWVADLAMKNGWRYTPRLQVQLWKNAWGT
jgi:organic radical activating enzyme